MVHDLTRPRPPGTVSSNISKIAWPHKQFDVELIITYAIYQTKRKIPYKAGNDYFETPIQLHRLMKSIANNLYCAQDVYGSRLFLKCFALHMTLVWSYDRHQYLHGSNTWRNKAITSNTCNNKAISCQQQWQSYFEFALSIGLKLFTEL